MKALIFRSYRWLPLAAGAALLGTTTLSAQSSDVAIAIASLREDIRILDERTRTLTVDMEQLRRENAGLRDLVRTQSSAQNVSVSQFNSAISELERAIRAGDKEVALQLTKQMERLAKETQSVLDSLARSTATRAPSVTTNFTDDYPRDGTTYTVQSGDTLSSIAVKFGAQIRDIQNANKIADPKTLQVGQTLFIPKR
ncbi:MAG TPA: LysM peptidoglycan-binding domain-containing protein [Opitutaceae bacterium]